MGDSDLSASELRKRYHRGGTVTDDELTSGIINTVWFLLFSLSHFKYIAVQHSYERDMQFLQIVKVCSLYNKSVVFSLNHFFHIGKSDFSTAADKDNAGNSSISIMITIAIVACLVIGFFLFKDQIITWSSSFILLSLFPLPPPPWCMNHTLENNAHTACCILMIICNIIENNHPRFDVRCDRVRQINAVFLSEAG